ncbi:MAG TPA: M4 family metallopeptidase, partial [Anaerolineales bacterium]|nr:M4 family metallopeptidase [Anaerolineales bacterium]
LSTFRVLGLSLHPQDPARALADRFAPDFGIKDPTRELSAIKTNHAQDGRVIVRYQQNHQGVPVLGGELIVNTNENGDLYSMNGEVSPNLSLRTQPGIDSDHATQTALQAIAKYYQKTPADFVVTNPELWIFDESLLQPSTRPAELVWRMEVTSKESGMPVRELALVNARTGGLSLHFNQIDNEWADRTHAAGNPQARGAAGNGCSPTVQSENLSAVDGYCEPGINTSLALLLHSPHVNTYTAEDTPTLPGTFLCNQTQPNCTNGGDARADAAHKYAIGTYNFYASNFLRDSIDNNGMVVNSTVHYCDPMPFFGCPYANAFWSGSQMVYGDAFSFPLADDVVAHELTHGVTQHESNLFYYYQSGAINESFSDLFGEYYDQTNGLGNDTVGVKWQIGEEVSDVGPLRSMSDPTAFGDPDKMSSPNYFEAADDGGGVHHNSGINNKAVYLMVNGGTFNGRTVSALGWEKTGAVYYEANANLLTSGADYSDLYYALQQACANLIGQKGITAGNCVEVKDAIDAVEMNAQPSPNFNTDAPFCDNGQPPSPVFSDNLESGTGNWVFGALMGTTRWQYDSPDGPFAHSGSHSLYAADSPADVTDTFARLKNPVLIPPQAFLHFDHAFGFEDIAPTAYDGGILEYSTDGGSAWQSAGPLFINNGYNGSIKPDELNPLAGKSAFVMDSHGYISSRLNLQSLANQSVLFRWRMGLDPFVSDVGWWVDDVQIYTCGALNPNVNIKLNGNTLGNYLIPNKTAMLFTYAGVNGGPVQVVNTLNNPIVSSLRLLYKNIQGQFTYSE